MSLLSAKKLLMSGAGDLDAAALISRMSPAPSAARKALITKTVRSLKAAGIWSKIHVLHVLAAHSVQAARLNWKADRYNIPNQGTDFITADVGLTAGHTDTGVYPDQVAGFQLDNAHVIVSHRSGSGQTSIVAGRHAAAGAVQTNLKAPSAPQNKARVTFNGYTVDTGVYVENNDVVEKFTGGSYLTVGGQQKRYGFMNDAVSESVSNASFGENRPWLLAAYYNNSGLATGQGGYPHRLFSVGLGLTRTEIDAYRAIMFNYMKSVVQGINL